MNNIFGGYYSVDSHTWSTNPKFKEILKLDQMLTEANIPHTLERNLDGWQVCYPNKEDCVLDAIEHWCSYGNRDDRLEIMGLLTPEEEAHDSVVGHLTAEDVLERIAKHYTGQSLLYIFHDRFADEIIGDFNKLVEKAKSYGLDIKLTPTSESSLVLYFHEDYPNTILVDKSEPGL